MKKSLPLIIVFILLLSICLNSCDTIVLFPGTQTEIDTEELTNGESTESESLSFADGTSTENNITGEEGNSDNAESDTTKEENTDNNGGDNGNIGWVPDAEHSDKDNNGLCDDCGISVIVVLDLFAINDLHGKFCDSSTQAGVDEMTTYLKNAYMQEDHVLVLSSGDMWQGSSESNLTKGHIITEWMNEIDVVSMTLGNHEYDWGEEFIAENEKLADFPFLAINVYDTNTNQRVEYCQPSVMVECGGALVGIIGAIGDCHSSIFGEVSGGVYFKTGSELASLVKEESQRLHEQGADFIVYSIHDGHGRSSSGTGSIFNSQLSAYYDPTLSNGYVDIVFEGHSHQTYVLQDAYGIYHLQGGGDNKGITHAEVSINFANGNNSIQKAGFVPSSVYGDLADDPIVETLMKKYDDQVSAGLRVLGINEKYRTGDELCGIIADLYLKAGIEAFGDAYDIVLGGGFLSVRSPYNLSAGQVTYGQLQMLFPFDNDIVLCSIKGSDLKNRFINTTNSNYFNSYSDYGISVKDNIDPNATYYVIVDTYSATYAPNRLTEVARYTPGVYGRDLLAKYIEAGGLGSANSEIEYTSIPEILAIGANLEDNALTDEGYYVKGTVVSVTNTTYGNIYIQDEDGNQLYIYGVKDATGSVRYDGMSEPPVIGDEITLLGQIKRYVYQGTVTIELMNSRLIPDQ